MEIALLGKYRPEMAVPLRNQISAICLILILLSETIASPVWMPQFLSGGQGRSIRHLPCVSRRTGEQGICMFAYTCLKSNGTHLGTCIDRFYFGSCCKLADADDLLVENAFPVISSNQVTAPSRPPATDPSHTFSVEGELQKITDNLLPATTKISPPPQTTRTTTPRTESVTGPGKIGTTDRTTVRPVEQLATETYVLPGSTDKVFVPVHAASPNGTRRPGAGGDEKKPTAEVAMTTQAYLLSTFQMVHNEGEGTAPTTVAPLRRTSPGASLVSTWTQSRPDQTTANSVRKNATEQAKPTQHTTRKPAKPVKPYTTTRKPSTKKPTTATAPTKKPSHPTKKPTGPKPATRPSPKPNPTASTATATAPTAQRYPQVSTTSEVVFTRPGTTGTPEYGITTFRPDLAATSTQAAPTAGSGLTTFSYVSEGAGETTAPPPPTTASAASATSATTSTTSTTSAGASAPAAPGDGVSEAQGENFGPVYQQVSVRPPVPATSVRPGGTDVPFFPDAEKPGTQTQWVQMVQTSPKPESSPAATTTVATTANGLASTALTILAGLNQSDYTQVCGRRIYPQARVVGGEKSTFGKWPWQISLRQWRTSTYLHKCGAALLNENWAITAAHCVENVPPSDLLLRLGEHDLSTEDEPFGFQERRVQIVASHPQFDPRTFEYDLALLRFYEPVKFQPNIIPVCVPEDNTNFVGQTAYVTGWGRLYEDGPLPSVLQEVSVPVINNTLCENMYRSAGYIEHIPEIFICAGWKKGGFDSCEGDSGGPMVIQRPDKRWLLAGVISWGIGCAEPNQPGVYTRISEFREWIHQILQF